MQIRPLLSAKNIQTKTRQKKKENWLFEHKKRGAEAPLNICDTLHIDSEGLVCVHLLRRSFLVRHTSPVFNNNNMLSSAPVILPINAVPSPAEYDGFGGNHNYSLPLIFFLCLLDKLVSKHRQGRAYNALDKSLED